MQASGPVNNSASPSSGKFRKIRIHVVPVLVSVGFIAVMLALYSVVYAIDSILPSPLYLTDEHEHPDAFIAERARQDLKLLTDSNQSEILAVDFLKRKINLMKQFTHKNQKLELDIQKVTLDYANTTFSFSNVIVKLHANNNASQSLLINAHFDSAPNSPWRIEDAINCVAMLEIIRILSRQPQRPVNNVIFLFNGAEERGLQGATAFITEHKWAKDCQVVLNLEGMGAGGKIILLQIAPEAPWLLKYYHKVPHPCGQTVGEEIFQNGFIFGDTDCLIFRDYGGLVGLDMAFFRNGRRNGFDSVPLGSLQHVGDNALSLVKDLANAPEVANPKEYPGKVVFFDFLGLFMVSYSTTVAQVLNYTVVVLSFGIFIYSILTSNLGSTKGKVVWYVALTIGAILGGWIAGAVFVAATAFILDECGHSLGWYTRPWLIFGLYSAPTLACSMLFLAFVNGEDICCSINSQIQLHSVRFIWTVILFIGTILNIRSMYVFLIPIIFNTATFVMIYFFKWQCKDKSTKMKSLKVYKLCISLWKWEVLYVTTLIIPTVFLMYESLFSLSFISTVSGRFESGITAELTAGMLTFLCTLLVAYSFVPLVTIVRNIKYITILLAILFTVSFIIIFTPIGRPDIEKDLY